MYNLNHKPYTEEQWQKIDTLGQIVEDKLEKLGVGLTMGGEPTFVSQDDFASLQWRVEALGEEKRKIAGRLLKLLAARFAKDGGLLHYGLGKVYAGEASPRWALGCYWREDGILLWHDRSLLAEDGCNCGHTQREAEIFMRVLVKHLGINLECLIPAYDSKTDLLAGYILPILPVWRNENLRWSSCRWTLATEKLYLLEGNSSIGSRLPISLLLLAELVEEAVLGLEANPTVTDLEPIESAPNSIRIALSIEIKQGTLHIFLPPLSSARSFIDAIASIETTAKELGMPVVLEGYTPPANAGIVGFQITPDPGVIEVNIHPAANWPELVEINTILYQEARACGLGTEKYLADGRTVSTGGGAHVTIGGKMPLESPILRRPDLLRSLLCYWQNHPSLSYLFSGLFVGPTSQSPRLDEARHESLYELEIAFAQLQPGIPPWLIDRLLRHLLVDVTGNTHRTAFCIDKLFPVENPRNQLGLLEFRFFAMPPHQRMYLLQMLLVRAAIAAFWEKPYCHSLIRWGTTLHDRFMLPHYLKEDLQEAIAELGEAGYYFELEWFEPFFAFRFPLYGEIISDNLKLELRHAIEPWHVLGEEVNNGGTARYVDDSMERLQVKLEGAIGDSANKDNFSSRYRVTCNDRLVPLKSTGQAGEYVGGVRFRAKQAYAMLHPTIAPHAPLTFDLVDTWSGKSLGGFIYYAQQPNGQIYENLPDNAEEARSRMAERFMPRAPQQEKVNLPSLCLNSEYPLTLDLRRVDG